MIVKLSSILAAAAFTLVLFSGSAVSATGEMDEWAKEAFSDPCMNGDVPADGILKAVEIPTLDT